MNGITAVPQMFPFWHPQGAPSSIHLDKGRRARRRRRRQNRDAKSSKGLPPSPSQKHQQSVPSLQGHRRASPPSPSPDQNIRGSPPLLTSRSFSTASSVGHGGAAPSECGGRYSGSQPRSAHTSAASPAPAPASTSPASAPPASPSAAAEAAASLCSFELKRVWCGEDAVASPPPLPTWPPRSPLAARPARLGVSADAIAGGGGGPVPFFCPRGGGEVKRWEERGRRGGGLG